MALPSSWPTSVSVRGVNNQTQDSSLRPFDHSTSLVTWASLSPGIFISLESQLQCPVLWLLRLLSLAFCHLGLLKLSVLWALRSLTLNPPPHFTLAYYLDHEPLFQSLWTDYFSWSVRSVYHHMSLCIGKHPAAGKD